jgi:glycosyltransferase involved in cell wall biosynthesis
MIKFTLVVATVGRTNELKRFLESLKIQTYRDFEVIIVDQNPPGFLHEVLDPFQESFPILRLRSEIGLSRARNIARDHVRGQIVAFPDDDCWYAADLLERVESLLANHPEWDGLTGQPLDPANLGGFPWYDKKSGTVDIKNVFHRSCSITIFLRSQALQTVGAFDEDLGRGASTGMVAAEETDYLIRGIRRGLSLFYLANVHLYHCALEKTHTRRLAVAFGENLAMGYILRKHNYSVLFVLHRWIRSLGGMALSILQGNRPKARYYWDSFRGRILGWFAGSQKSKQSAKKTIVRLIRWSPRSIAPIDSSALGQAEEEPSTQGHPL